MNRQLTKREETVASVILIVAFFLVAAFFLNNAHSKYVARYSDASTSMTAGYGENIQPMITSAEASTLEAHHYRSFSERLYPILRALGADSSVSIKTTPNACGTGEALACVLLMDGSTIQVDETMVFQSDTFLRGLLAHELAHVVNNRIPYTAFHSSGYLGAFNGDQEHIADCMAKQRVGYIVSSYGYTCSAQQLAIGKKIWDWYENNGGHLQK